MKFQVFSLSVFSFSSTRLQRKHAGVFSCLIHQTTLFASRMCLFKGLHNQRSLANTVLQASIVWAMDAFCGIGRFPGTRGWKPCGQSRPYLAQLITSMRPCNRTKLTVIIPGFCLAHMVKLQLEYIFFQRLDIVHWATDFTLDGSNDATQFCERICACWGSQ
jgi:hypothetical protein